MAPVASIAQSVEQGIENPRVGGSIPPRGTKFKKVLLPFPLRGNVPVPGRARSIPPPGNAVSEMVQIQQQRFHGLCAGLAQLVEQLTCNQ